MDVRQWSGWALVGAAAMVLTGMSHHPAGLQSGTGQLVHGFMILALVVTAFGFAGFVIDGGITRAPMLAGSIAFVVAVFGGIGAAVINGFIVPAVAASGVPIGRDVYRLAWAANQSLASLGIMATGGAFLFWSIDLSARTGRSAKIVGVLGLVAALAPAILLLTGSLRMDVSGALVIYTMQAFWGASVGVRMLAEARSSR